MKQCRGGPVRGPVAHQTVEPTSCVVGHDEPHCLAHQNLEPTSRVDGHDERLPTELAAHRYVVDAVPESHEHEQCETETEPKFWYSQIGATVDTEPPCCAPKENAMKNCVHAT